MARKSPSLSRLATIWKIVQWVSAAVAGHIVVRSILNAAFIRRYLLGYYTPQVLNKEPMSLEQGHGSVWISTEEFEERIRVVQERAPADERQGIFGMDSVTWKMDREAFLFLAAGRASLLQLAHPFVASAIKNHSQIGMVFGDRETAISAARTVRRIHDKVKGSFKGKVGPFDSLEKFGAHHQGAVIWVWATLVESSVFVYEMMIEKLEHSQKEQLFEEGKSFLLLFGVDLSAIPTDWNDFMDYNRRMWNSDILTVGEEAREMEKFLFHPARVFLWPQSMWVKAITTHQLPPRIRKQFEYPHNVSTKITFYASFGLLKALNPSLAFFPVTLYYYVPGHLRFIKDYLDAEKRVGVHRLEWPSKISVAFARLFLKVTMPERPPLDTLNKAAQHTRPRNEKQ